jgi:hypothetical protein
LILQTSYPCQVRFCRAPSWRQCRAGSFAAILRIDLLGRGDGRRSVAAVGLAGRAGITSIPRKSFCVVTNRASSGH